MKWLAPILILFSLVALTDPQGISVWVSREQVSSVVPPTTCDARARARVNTGDTFLCVRETVEQVISKLTTP